jgi:SAM-dependent methyltransferase
MSRQYGNKQKHESKNPVQRALIARFHGELARIVQAFAPSEILDVGCGEGYALSALREHGIACPLSGIDLSDEAIAEAKLRLPSASFSVENALDLAKTGRKYDLVMMTEVLEHIPNPERMLPVLEQIARRYVVLSVPWEPFFRGLNFMRGKHVTAFGNDPEHINHWGRGGFLRFVGERFEVKHAPLVFPWTLVGTELRDAREQRG